MKKGLTILSLIVLAAAAAAFVFSPGFRRSAKTYQRPAFAQKGDPDGGKEGEVSLTLGEPPGNQEAAVENRGEKEGGRLTWAEQDYANRAYPAEDIPFDATLNAQASFQQIKSRGVRGGKNSPGTWVAVGPTSANYPAVLAFSGHDYVTSGRITTLAIAPSCGTSNCRVWVAAAGGGIWRTDNALAGNPSWKFVSGSLGSNAIGSLLVDPNDASGQTIYAGTGEANASGDSEAGVGLYKSTNGGDSWAAVGTSMQVSYGRSIGSIAIKPGDPNVIYLATTRGVRGVSSVTGGATSNPPAAPAFGLYKSTDGGATWTYIWNGSGSIRGVRRVAVDPLNPDRVYASAYQKGIWRSDGGAFEQVFAPTAPLYNTDRTEFALTVKDGHTRIYAGDGAQGDPPASFWRVDNADVPAASLTDGTNNTGWKLLTNYDLGNPSAYTATYDYCTGQCWYDQFVYSPAGFPDVVYLGGSYQYGEYGWVSNSRAVLLSTDAGEKFTDMSWDASTPPVGVHPDQHALVTVPGSPYIFFEGSDGGLIRSSGSFKDISGQCASRGVPDLYLPLCQQLLSRVPSKLFSLNTGLNTLQFQSLSVNPNNYKNVMGGTQDNGTFETTGSYVVWPQIIYGDGGQSGFNAANPALRFNSFFGQFHDANFQNGDPTRWVIISGPIASSPEGSNFYAPIIADPNPAAAGTIFEGSQSVWRTQDWGGDQIYLETNCPEFTTSGANPACGDFVRIGPAGSTDLTGAGYGADRPGGFMAAIERTSQDTGTLWAATNTGRVYVSHNADAPAGSVTWTRIDPLSNVDPARFVSSIYVDPANANHAWISYSGYNFNTPATPGHVFDVVYDPAGGTATWTNIDSGTGPLGDLPVTDLVRDDVTGDLYAATDFGVLRLASGTSTWVLANNGMPYVEVAGLTIVPGSRVLYAATHGRGAWMLPLP